MKKKFYFHKRDNKILILFFSIIVIINIIAVLSNKGILEQSSIVLSILVLLPFSFTIKKDNSKSYNSYLSYNRIKTATKNTRDNWVGVLDVSKNIEFEKGAIVPRDKHIKNLLSLIDSVSNTNTNIQTMGIVLTGDSGSGKSTIINELESELNKNDNYTITKEVGNYINYFSFKEYNDNKIQIILLDQFEKVFNRSGFFNKLKKWDRNSHSKCILIFSFPQNYLSRMKSLFIKNGISNLLDTIYVLAFNEDDIEKYENKIAIFTNKEFEDIKKYIDFSLSDIPVPDIIISKIGKYSDCRKLCDELIKVIKGEGPLIELELLGYILSLDISEFKTYSKEYSIINIYLDDWVERFEHPETAYAFLYLLSEYKTYSIDNIRLACFEENDNFVLKYKGNENGSIIQALDENFLISDIRQKDNVLAYEAAHQYIADQFRKYCQSREIPENLRYYIDHLRKCIESKNTNNENAYSYRAIQDRYQKYYSKHFGINLMISIMFIAVLIINIIKYKSDNYIHYQLIAISVVDLPSIYYIYNYCVRFLLISDNVMIKLTYIVGPLVIALSYVFINAWGILLGIEIIVLSLAILYTHFNHTYEIPQRAFKKDFIVFISIGTAVIVLGIIYYNIVMDIELRNNDYIWLKIYRYSNYVVFLIYVILSVFNHIKYSYMIGRIGLSNIYK